jgi:O-antigen/teichoic acid export membrane protein
VFSNSDIFFINHFLGSYNVGLYKIATTFSSIILVVIGVFGNIYLSKVKLNMSGEVDLLKKYHNQLGINFTLTALFFLFSLSFNNIILPKLYGQEASMAVSCSVLYSFALIPNVMSMVNTHTLFGLEKENKMYFISIIAIFINLITSYLFINSFGIIGGAFANFTTSSYIFTHTYITLRNIIYK